MQVHLPKPLHGWRAFAGEVGIIVLGVLIALGAGQLLEKWQWDRKADRATELLREEIADEYVEASEAAITAPCVDRQLLGLEARLTSAGGRFEPAPSYAGAFGDVTFRAPSRVWSDDVWRSVVSDGVASHLPQNLRFKLGRFYAQIEFMRNDNRATDLTSWRLRALARPMQPDAATRANLIEELEQTRGHIAELAFVGNEIVALVQEMKFAPTRDYVSQQLGQSGTLSFCRAHHLPLASVHPIHNS
jgi:hypothetical protein